MPAAAGMLSERRFDHQQGMLLLLLFLAGLACLVLTAWLLKWRPIDSWRNFHLRWSTWLHGSGFLSIAAYSGIWDRMPKPLRELVPDNLFLAIGVLLWAAGALSVYVKQRHLDPPRPAAGLRVVHHD